MRIRFHRGDATPAAGTPALRPVGGASKPRFEVRRPRQSASTTPPRFAETSSIAFSSSRFLGSPVRQLMASQYDEFGSAGAEVKVE